MDAFAQIKLLNSKVDMGENMYPYNVIAIGGKNKYIYWWRDLLSELIYIYNQSWTFQSEKKDWQKKDKLETVRFKHKENHLKQLLRPISLYVIVY